MSLGRDSRFDSTIVVVRELGVDTVWDARIKNLVYNTVSMEWEAQASAASGGPTTISADTSSIETRAKAMKTVVDEASTTVTYVGDAATGAALATAGWRIRRMTQAGAVLTTEWADGDGLYNNVWNNRTILTYS